MTHQQVEKDIGAQLGAPGPSTDHQCLLDRRSRGRLGILSALIVLALVACRLAKPSPQPTRPAIDLTVQAIMTPTSTSVSQTPISVPGDGQERLLGSFVMLRQGIPPYCPQFQQYHVRFTWITVPWNGVEPRKGHFKWEEADAVVQPILACDGLELAFRVTSNARWATLPPSPSGGSPGPIGRVRPGTAPADMQDYYDFMFNLASHYKGKVTRYSIEEEAHATDIYWGGTPEQYMELLATAHKAVHDADPNAIVYDSGLSSPAVGTLYAYDLFRDGKTDEAGRFLESWFAHYKPKRLRGETIEFRTAAELQAVFEQDEFKRLLKWVDLLWGPYSESYDVQRIHYKGPWNVMPQVLSWLHGQMKANGSDKPIELWEFGYGWDDPSTYDPLDHARQEAKYMAMAIGEGVLRALSWQFTDYAVLLGHPGLVTADGPRPAAVSFGVAAEKVNGTTHSARLDLGQDVWAYRFDKDSGTVYALWSAQPTRVDLPINASSVIVTDITGTEKTADPRALDVGIDPIFVQAR